MNLRAVLFAPLVLAAGAAAAPVEYLLTPTHSFVHFELQHLGLSTTRGRFDRAAGRVLLDRDAHRGSAQISVRLDMVNTGNAALDQALRAALGAGTEARAQFTADAFGFDGDQVRSVRGELVLRGTRQAIELQAERFNCYLNPLLLREVCGGDFVTTLELPNLGVRIDPALGLGNGVRLHVQVEAIRQEAAP